MNVDTNTGVYVIRAPDGRMYVGSSRNIPKRWRLHRSHLAKGKHHCKALQDAYDQNGGNLVFEVIMNCNEDDLLNEEQRAMDLAYPGTLLNTCPYAASCLGVKHTNATKIARSRFRTGKKLPNNTSGYVGVHNYRGRWQAKRKINGKTIHIGYYATPELANQARQEFDRRYEAGEVKP